MNTAKMFQMRPEFLPLSIVRSLWKGKWLALLVWSVVTAAVAAVVSRMPAVYYSDALIVVDSPKIPERLVSSLVANDFNDRLSRITQQIQSSTRLKEIMREVNLYSEERKKTVPEDLVQGMRRNIRLSMEGGRRANAFRIGFEGGSPAVVAQVANRLANLYIEENLKVRESQAEGTTEFVEAQLQEAKKKLDDLEAAITRYKQQHNGELPQQEPALANRMARLQTDIRVNADALQRAHDSKQMLETSLPSAEAALAALLRPGEPVIEGEPGPAQAAAPAPAAPRRASEQIEGELRALRARYTADHPDVKRLHQKLAAARAGEDEEPPPPLPQQPAPPAPRRTAAAKPAPGETPDAMRARERISTLQAQLKRTEKEIDDRNKEVARLQQDSAAVESRLQQLPIREQEYAQLTRDYQITRGNYDSLMGKKLSAEMSTDLERRQKAERFTILEPARVPAQPTRPNRPMFALMGSCAGLAAGILLAMGREFKRGVLLGEWELADEYPVLGRLPRIALTSAAPEAVRG